MAEQRQFATPLAGYGAMGPAEFLAILGDERGVRVAVARRFGVSESLVTLWSQGLRRIPNHVADDLRRLSAEPDKIASP